MPGMGFLGGQNKLFIGGATVGTTPTPAPVVLGPYFLLPKFPGELDDSPELVDDADMLSAAWINFGAMVLEQIEAEIGPEPGGAWGNLKDMLNDLSLSRNTYGIGKIGGIYRMSISGTSAALHATGQALTTGATQWDYRPNRRLICFGHMTGQNWSNLINTQPALCKFHTSNLNDVDIYHRCFTASGLQPTATGTFIHQFVAFQMHEGGPL